MPRLTGRKRKRGAQNGDSSSNGSNTSAGFVHDEQLASGLPVDGDKLRRILRNNPHDYRVEAVGRCGTAHRFRCMISPACMLIEGTGKR